MGGKESTLGAHALTRGASPKSLAFFKGPAFFRG